MQWYIKTEQLKTKIQEMTPYTFPDTPTELYEYNTFERYVLFDELLTVDLRNVSFAQNILNAICLLPEKNMEEIRATLGMAHTAGVNRILKRVLEENGLSKNIRVDVVDETADMFKLSPKKYREKRRKLHLKLKKALESLP